LMSIKGKVARDLPNRKTICFEQGGKQYFIKQHFGIGYWEIFKNLFMLRLPIDSARNEWEALRLLSKHHIETPKPIGFGQKGLNPATKKSFMLMSALENKLSAYDLAIANKNCPYKENIILEVARLTKKMHTIGVVHRDYYLVHIWLDAAAYEQGEIKLCLHDFHRALIFEKLPKRWLIKDLASLYFSAMDFINKDEALLFFKTYFNSKSSALDLKLLKKIQTKAIGVYYKEHHRYPPKECLIFEKVENG